jgi:hypothetical protein
MEIRLVTLHPGMWDEEIQCSISKYPLGPNIKYEALSWCWGIPNPETDPWILLQDQKFSITPNLEAALRHLRDGHGSRLLWVDALCINQVDEQEKAVQVQIMSLIFAFTYTTVIWLGPIDEESSCALRFIQKTAEAMFEMVDGQLRLQTPELRRRTFSRLNDPFDPRPLVAVSRLFQRPWFERMWV